MKESCGVFGVYAPGEDVARLTFFGLYALQHRGQESAGIAVSDGELIRVHKDMGLVNQVFNEGVLRPLVGDLAIGHTRYSTKGASRIVNAQPFLLETKLGPLGVAHNGNLVNAAELRYKLLQDGVGLVSTSDSEVITQMLAGSSGGWVEHIRSFMSLARGAYSLTILTRDALYAVRDPWGVRPLCLGRLAKKGWVVASESCALSTIGAEFVREVEPGEIIIINKDGLKTIQRVALARQALCSFEFIYFARPDSVIKGQLVHNVRQQLGARVAMEHPVEADLVIGVPDSATPASIGYAQEAKIPYNAGLIKNRYIGRTFIQPSESLRQLGIALKYNALSENLKGKRVIVVEDSVVRGNTGRPIIALLRAGGAREVHLRVTSPPIYHPCYLGVDMPTSEELIAYRLKEISIICNSLGADSLGYLSIEGLMDVLNQSYSKLCLACFSGDYPVDKGGEEKFAFERCSDSR